MAVFSDNLIHDTVAVYLIQEIIIDYLKKSFDFVKKIIYFTDGAAQHFKNKHNFQNLHHYENFPLKLSGTFMRLITKKMHAIDSVLQEKVMLGEQVC